MYLFEMDSKVLARIEDVAKTKLNIRIMFFVAEQFFERNW
jgi:hypothetical protein